MFTISPNELPVYGLFVFELRKNATLQQPLKLFAGGYWFVKKLFRFITLLY